MSNETTNTNPQNMLNEVVKTYPNIVAKVTKVMLPENGNDNRITFVLDKEFETIDKNTGEHKQTNMFGLNIFAVVNQVSQFVPEIQLADTLALGKTVNPQIVSLAMTNANIEIKNTFRAKGEKRQNTDDVYSNDCVTREIVKVKTNILPVFATMLERLIFTAPAIVTQTSATVPNPFNVIG